MIKRDKDKRQEVRVIATFPFCASNELLILLTELPDGFDKRVAAAINEAYRAGRGKQ